MLPSKLVPLAKEAAYLALLEELSETRTTRQQEAGRGVEVRTELGERGDITVLGEVQLERTGDSLHDLFSGGASASVRVLVSGSTRRRTLVWAADPTRETERPTLMAGRTPLKKSSASRKIWPSLHAYSGQRQLEKGPGVRLT